MSLGDKSAKLTCSAKIVGRKVVGGLVGKVVDEPSVPQWAICHVGHAQFPCSLDQAVCLVQSLKS